MPRTPVTHLLCQIDSRCYKKLIKMLSKIFKNSNANVECSASCYTVAGSSELSHNDQVTLSNKNKESTADTLLRQSRDIYVNSGGDGIFNSNILDAVQSNIVARDNEHSLELVTSKILTNTTQGGCKNQHMSNPEKEEGWTIECLIVRIIFIKNHTSWLMPIGARVCNLGIQKREKPLMRLSQEKDSRNTINT